MQLTRYLLFLLFDNFKVKKNRTEPLLIVRHEMLVVVICPTKLLRRPRQLVTDMLFSGHFLVEMLKFCKNIVERVINNAILHLLKGKPSEKMGRKTSSLSQLLWIGSWGC